MKRIVKDIYKKFDERRKAYEAKEADLMEIEELKQIEEKLKR